MSNEMNAFKRHRLLKGWSAQDVADRLDISVKVYYYYESGKRFPHVKRLKQIADLYQVSMEEFLN